MALVRLWRIENDGAEPQALSVEEEDAASTEELLEKLLVRSPALLGGLVHSHVLDHVGPRVRVGSRITIDVVDWQLSRL